MDTNHPTATSSSGVTDDATRIEINDRQHSPGKDDHHNTNLNTGNSSSNVKSLLNSDPATAESVPVKNQITLRSQIMEEFGINSASVAGKDNIDPDAFNTLVQIRLIKERKAIETMRKENLIMLNDLVDKCISNDKFDETNINKLLDIIIEKRATNMSTIRSRQDTLMSPMIKKRRIQSPHMSATKQSTEYRGQNSDLHAINETDAGQSETDQFQSVAQSYKLPVPPPTLHQQNIGNTPGGGGGGGAVWTSQYQNPSLQPPYMYQTGAAGSMQGNLGPPAHLMNDPHYQQQGMMTSTYDPQMGKQYLEPPQYIQNYPQGGYYPPNGRVMNSVNEQAYPGIPQGHATTIGQQHSPYRGNIATASGQTGRKGHRRTQSAIVSMPNELKSPSRSVPQRPVNFLIHTPKHPPPT
ncbi:similar to Saccharomyces cerevisiae YIL122W POG1 Nuclear chromatin-associated protein of unknown function [Maudiozyma saulgeensis]|uniref:Transcriptional activator POG1 n=1 Tax=Maudiozyma saulgeensis TaxID=1789683 RepID=A0A1X7R4I3_9SACH|nr:similar to Saccharomyces cerevisiae YIL122W POG1 Nuclear chromatin-associated protein of unknown function [Kazachstania saulgeensis]